MPHLKSAKKRAKQSLVRRARNRATIKELKTQIKRFLSALKTGVKADAEKALREAQAKLDKCGIRGYIHKNAASRTKARLTARLNAMGAAPAEKAEKK
jgi:small subunit ribosomal protein S20